MNKKNLTKTVAILLFLLVIGALRAEILPEAKMTFLVKDDAGRPIPDLEVRVFTFHHWEPGEGFGKDIHKESSAKTNNNGEAVITARSLTGRFEYNVLIAGYYHIGWKNTKIVFSTRENGRWNPWNPTTEITVKRILKPIPMYISYRDKKIPTREKEIGFDMMVDDFVAPYGRGIHSDFIFKLEEKIPFKGRLLQHDYRLKITFPNKEDGIQSCFAPVYDSEFDMPRYAPTNDYKDVLELKSGFDDKGYFPQREDQNYFFRIRTALDKDGKIVSALYGKIIGNIDFWYDGTLRFSYFLNPNPLDVNMEQNRNENLVPPPPDPPKRPRRPRKLRSTLPTSPPASAPAAAPATMPEPVENTSSPALKGVSTQP